MKTYHGWIYREGTTQVQEVWKLKLKLGDDIEPQHCGTYDNPRAALDDADKLVGHEVKLDDTPLGFRVWS